MASTALLGGAYSAEAQAMIDGHTADRASALAKLTRHGEGDSMAPTWKTTIARTTGWIADLEPWLED